MEKTCLAIFLIVLILPNFFAQIPECNSFGNNINHRLENVKEICSTQDKTTCKIRSYAQLYHLIVEDENNWNCFNSGVDFNKELFSELYLNTIDLYDELIEVKKEENITEAISLLEEEYKFLTKCERYGEILGINNLCETREEIKERYERVLDKTARKVRKEIKEEPLTVGCETYYTLVKNYSGKLSGFNTKLILDKNSEYIKDTFFDSIQCGGVCLSYTAWTTEPEKGIECYNIAKKILNDWGPYFSKKYLNIDYQKTNYSIDKNLVKLAKKKDDYAEIVKYANIAGKSAFLIAIDKTCKKLSVEECENFFFSKIKDLNEEEIGEVLKSLTEAKNYYKDAYNEKEILALFPYLMVTRRISIEKNTLNRILNFERILDEIKALFYKTWVWLVIYVFILVIFTVIAEKYRWHLKMEKMALGEIKAKDIAMIIATLWVGSTIAFSLSLQFEGSFLQTISSNNVTAINYFLDSENIETVISFIQAFKIIWATLTFSLFFNLIWIFFKENSVIGYLKWTSIIFLALAILEILAFARSTSIFSFTLYLLFVSMASPFCIKCAKSRKAKRVAFIIVDSLKKCKDKIYKG